MEDDNNVEQLNKNKRNQEMRILVVDDSDLSRKTIVNILEEEGFNIVAQANSAETALQQAFSAQANIFLLDVIMPNKSGIELAELIRENIKEAKIIMMSSLDTESVLIDSISTGAIDFLVKPFTKDTLIKALSSIESIVEKEAV